MLIVINDELHKSQSRIVYETKTKQTLDSQRHDVKYIITSPSSQHLFNVFDEFEKFLLLFHRRLVEQVDVATYIV